MNRTILTLIQLASWLALGSAVPPTHAQTGTLADTYLAPAQNAALHYQRGILHLALLNDEEREVLSVPIWDILAEGGNKTNDTVRDALAHGAPAVHAATRGARISRCNFGIDFSDFGASTRLPHLRGMVELGRLLTLRGLAAEEAGQWEKAGIIYFDGLRMGRHLAHQNTLLECLSGIEILRNNYHALANWAARCPSQPLVARSFGLFEAIQNSLVNPSEVLARESSVLSIDFERLEAAYPDGDWAKIILVSYGEKVTGKPDEDAERAIAVCKDRGVPASAFENLESFQAYLSQLHTASHRFAESLSACVSLPPRARLKRASSLNRKYAELIPILSDTTLIDAVEVSVLFAEHEAELTLARLALAIAASKADGTFPDSLDDVSFRFGGQLPESPYGGAPIQYEQQGDQFSLAIESSGPLPRLDYNSLPPAPADTQ